MIKGKYKSITPGLRGATKPLFSDITKKEPEKSLTKGIKKQAGRNTLGRITVRHRGGGAKKAYRKIDFKRDKIDILATVKAIEYDPSRSARIALLYYKDGEKRYIIAPQGLKVGDEVISSEKAEIKPGNCLPLVKIPAGTPIYNIELQPNKGGVLVRSAGVSAKIMGKENGYVLVKLPSLEVRKILESCRATVGEVSNPSHKLMKIGKAGRKRKMGVRPSVRGKAMAPVDHPHGGGEGSTDIGLIHPKTPWGAPALGKKTRKRKITNKFIVKRRKK